MDTDTKGVDINRVPVEHDLLLQDVIKLQQARLALDGLQTEWENRLAAFRDANADLLDGIAGGKQICADLDEQIRTAAVARWANGMAPDKRPAPGVSIRLMTRLTYDKDTALAWCRSNLPNAVITSLDSKAFDKVAKVMPLAFVSTGYEAVAVISTDLSAALGQQGVDDGSKD